MGTDHQSKGEYIFSLALLFFFFLFHQALFAAKILPELGESREAIVVPVQPDWQGLA